MDQIIHGDCLEVLRGFDNDCIDLTVTSPPYDNLRTYNGYTFDFEGIAKELYRVTKPGGVVVWVVGDATIKGSETGTSFRQALYFKDIGFNLHDTMIYHKLCYVPLTHNRYEQAFEYMFVLSKGKPKTFNPRLKKNIESGKKISGGFRHNGKDLEPMHKQGGVIKEFSIDTNVWSTKVGWNHSYTDEFLKGHPAIFPEKLAEDHILSWSNEGDTVLDPMCGSGTTLKMAKKNNRNYIGIEISQEYIEIANTRLNAVT